MAPYHTTIPHLTADSWREHAANKKQAVLDAIPPEWKLNEKYTRDIVSSDDGEEKTPKMSVLHVPDECGILTPKELEITELDDVEILLERIRTKRYTSREVTVAFCKRASIAHQLTNCLTEILFDSAQKRAKQLDEHLATTGQLIGPLHGLVVSVKDQFDIKDIEMTMGYAAFLGRVSTRNASLVEMLEDLGAILYVRTNVPQTLAVSDTFNWVFGRTRNPYDLSRSPGGSSGGEAALIAMKGSILGCGTDIGGSLRIPSAVCGLHAIKPSSRRVPLGKATNSWMGQESIPTSAGPMARSLKTVNFFMKAILDNNPAKFDSGALPFAYNYVAYETAMKQDKLVIGVATDLTLSKPVWRALEVTVAALRAAGHEIVDFPCSEYKRAESLAGELCYSDGCQEVKAICDAISEPLIPELWLPGPESLRNGYQVNTLNHEKEELSQQFLSYWEGTQWTTQSGRPLDALLVPAAQIPAVKPRNERWFGFTSIFNTLDLPAVVLPVTRVDAEKDALTFMDELRGKSQGDCIWRFNAAESAGLPVGMQLIGRRWQEEALLAVSSRVEEAVKAAAEQEPVKENTLEKVDIPVRVRPAATLVQSFEKLLKLARHKTSGHLHDQLSMKSPDMRAF